MPNLRAPSASCLFALFLATPQALRKGRSAQKDGVRPVIAADAPAIASDPVVDGGTNWNNNSINVNVVNNISINMSFTFPSAQAQAESAGKSGAQAQTPAVADRGTGLSPGEWIVDGGLLWNGIDINPSFKLSFKVNSISVDHVNVDAHGEGSYLNGENLPEGGYNNLSGTYASRVQVDWWSYKSGYLIERNLCTAGGTCMTKLFLPEGDSKLMLYGSVSGITAWVTSGNGARYASAAADATSATDELVDALKAGEAGVSPDQWLTGGTNWNNNSININVTNNISINLGF